MLKQVRNTLDWITSVGFNEDTVFKAVPRFNLTFEEFFALIVLMEYYFYQDSYLSPVIFVFYSTYREKIAKQYPNEDRDQRMLLIATNTSIIANQLKNETDLEMVTKNAVRELFG